MKRSNFYNFYLPESTQDDLADIGQISSNFEGIDTLLHNIGNKVDNISPALTFRGAVQTLSQLENLPESERVSGYTYAVLSEGELYSFVAKDNAFIKSSDDIIVEITGYVEQEEFDNLVDEVDIAKEDIEELKENVPISYIIETGTSGIWTYRKWSDGTAECWGTAELKNQTFTNTWGSLYECSNSFPSVDYPLEFSNIPVETVNVASSAPAVFIYTGANDGRNTATKCGRYLAVRASQYATPSDVWCNYYVIGRWDDEN